jgi:hypothetical protein
VHPLLHRRQLLGSTCDRAAFSESDGHAGGRIAPQSIRDGQLRCRLPDLPDVSAPLQGTLRERVGLSLPADVDALCNRLNGNPGSAIGSEVPGPDTAPLVVDLSPRDRTRVQLTFDQIAQSIAVYEAEVSPFSSKFDAFLVGKAELSEAERRGYTSSTVKRSARIVMSTPREQSTRSSPTIQHPTSACRTILISPSIMRPDPMNSDM